MANLVTTMVATAVIGIAAPGVARMATQPMIAQQRATNFGIAESKVVQFSAINEGNEAIDMSSFDEEKCELKEPEARAYTVKCSEGEGQFYMEAERAFRLEVENNTFDKQQCELKEPEARAYTIRCWEGEGQFYMEAERAFRLEVNNNTFTNPQRQFAWSAPLEHSHHQCHANDPWGVIWFNEHLAASGIKPCIPGDAWNEQKYLRSDPDDWLWDLSNYGFGVHPDY